MARPIIRPSSTRKPIGLALQGGGSWGAYTWGVLDALLARRSIAITQLSGTSGGAINAAIVAGALAKGSTAQARHALSPTSSGDDCNNVWLGCNDELVDSCSVRVLRAHKSPLGLNVLEVVCPRCKQRHESLQFR